MSQSESQGEDRWFTTPGRVIVRTVLTIGFIVVACVLALMLGWHPLPDTKLGCSLHITFHSHNLHIEPHRIVSADCIDVSRSGRDTTIRDAQRIAALRSWLAARTDGWEENFSLLDQYSEPGLTIRACSPRRESDEYIYVNQDWLGFFPGKNLMRPICREEWRQLVDLVSF